MKKLKNFKIFLTFSKCEKINMVIYILEIG